MTALAPIPTCVPVALALGFLLGLAGIEEPALAETLAVAGEEVHTVSGAVIREGVVLVEDGRIVAVGPAADVTAPSDATPLAARVVTPGLIDAQTSAGLAGLYNVPADSDQDEETDPNQAELRALDAFNPQEPLLRHRLEHGVTLVQSGPGPANPIGGQAGIFRTHGRVADAMVVRAPSAVVFSLGERPKSTYSETSKLPMTRMGTAALIRQALQAGAEYARKRREAVEQAEKDSGGSGEGGAKPPDTDLEKEALALVTGGQLPALFVAHRADDILTALRIGREFSLKTILAGATEGYLVADELVSAKVPVLVGPIMTRVGSPETENATFENAAILADRGVPIAIRSGFESYVPRARVVLFEAAIAAANGLGPQRALRAITLGAAELLGVASDHGSLEPGKVADLVLFDGDPFEYTSHVEAVVAGGEVVYVR